MHDWVDVDDIPFEGGPDLPPLMATLSVPWPARTQAKWDAWRTMPHCAQWGAAEWDFALDSIELAGLFHMTGEAKYATELRNREKVLGTTLESRQALRIRYVEPKPSNAAGEVGDVVSIVSYLDL